MSTAQIVPGILVILIGYLGCDIILALIVWFIAVTLITASYAGAMANIVDIAPNFAGKYNSFKWFFYNFWILVLKWTKIRFKSKLKPN